MEERVSKHRAGHFYIDETCIGCGACDGMCPGKVHAIEPIQGDFRGRFKIVLEDCIDCGFCVPVCPVDCIHDARKEGVVEGEGGYMRIKELQAWAEKLKESGYLIRPALPAK